MSSAYRLHARFTEHRYQVAVIGCGGTGGFLAEGLCRLLPDQADLVLVDHDRVEERNLTRQNFTAEDLGGFKSERLARRLAQRYGRPVAYSTLPTGTGEAVSPRLILGCVDNGPARAAIARALVPSSLSERQCWWVDAGNGQNYGQILIGNAPAVNMRNAFDEGTLTCCALPLPTVQMPTLLAEAPRALSCAEAVERGDQGPTINQVMASLMLEVVRRLITGTCTWMQLYVDMDAGTMTAVPASPEAVSRVLGRKQRPRQRGGAP
jgi:hypothetical protein